MPLPGRPNEGRIEFFVDCSANATPEFEGRGGNELATEISRTLSRAYRDPQVFDLKSLCLLPGRQVLYNSSMKMRCNYFWTHNYKSAEYLSNPFIQFSAGSSMLIYLYLNVAEIYMMQCQWL